MTKNEFMTMLDDLLKDIPSKERQDILYDYEEHFQIALESGKSEEEIAAMLGNPKTIAKELKATYHINQAQTIAPTEATVDNLGRAMLATIALGLFNLIFVLGPFIALIGVLIALFATSLAITFLPISLIVFTIAIPSNPLELLQAIFIIMTTSGLGVLMMIGMIYVSKWFYIGFIKYLRFNVRIIKGR